MSVRGSMGQETDPRSETGVRDLEKRVANRPRHEQVVLCSFEMLDEPQVQTSHKCRIPDDYIDENRYPLFMARAVLRELIESLQATGSATPC